MIGTRMRKILRDVWTRKTRTGLVAISIFFGVFGTVMLFTMGDLFVAQLREDLKEEELAMTRAFTTVNPNATVDNAALLAQLRALPGVTDVEGQAVYPVSWRSSPADDFESAAIFGYSEAYDQIDLEPMRLREGRFPVAGQNEVAVERRFAEENDLGLNDTFNFRILSLANAETGDVPEETWTIVGIVNFTYPYGGNFNPVLPADSIFAAYEDAQYIAAFSGFSSFYARYESFELAEAGRDGFTALLRDDSPYVPYFIQLEDPAENSVIAFAETISGVMASLGILALIVSGFLVVNVINTIVVEQKQQIGVMKSLGASRPDNFLMYTGIALFYGLLGAIPGTLLGIPVGYVAAQGLATSANSVIEEFGLSPRAIIFGLSMGLAVPVIASLIPVLNAMRVRIIDALTDLGISSSYGHGPLARLTAALPLTVTMRQGVSNILRKKSRNAFTIVTLATAAGAFMGVFAVFASINEVLEDFYATFNFQFEVAPNERNVDLENVETVIESNIEGLTFRGYSSGVEVAIAGYEKEYDPTSGPPALFANGYELNSDAYRLTLAEGQTLEAYGSRENTAIISRSIADALDKAPGDTVTISAAGNSADFTIAGIASYPYDGVWMDWQQLSLLAGYVDAAGNPAPIGLLFSMSQEDPTGDDVDDVLSDITELLLQQGITARYQNIELFTETIDSTVGVFQLIFNLTAFLVALVGAVGLLTTLFMSVFERQKEIGVMRSIGAGSGSIVTQYLTEGVVIGLLAWLIGLPLSYVLSDVLIASLNLGDEYQLTYPAIAVVIGFVGTLIIAVVASIWPSISAARRTVSDILRYQ